MREIYTKPEQIIKLDEPRNEDGNILFSKTFDELKWNGETVHPLQIGYDFESNISDGENVTITNFDIEITTEKLLQGGMYWILNPSDVDVRDYVNFAVVDRNGVVIHPEYGVSLFTLLGLTPSVDVLELQPIVSNIKIKKGCSSNCYFYYPLQNIGDSSPVISGIFMRASYHSFSTVPINFYMELITYEK